QEMSAHELRRSRPIECPRDTDCQIDCAVESHRGVNQFVGAQDMRSHHAQALDCIAAIEWGLTERVWHDEDVKLLQTIPLKERRDHLVWIEREACIRKIM